MKNIIKDIAGKVWAAPMTLFGIVAGILLIVLSLITKNGGIVSIENNAITFTTGLNLNGSITFGNVIIHAGGDTQRWNSNSLMCRYNLASYVNLGKHEEAHTYQYQTYGIFMIALLVASSIANGGLKASNFYEFLSKSAFENAADDYAQFGKSPIPWH